MNFKNYIREVQDFPKKGVSFKDITPLLENAKVFYSIIQKMALPYKGEKIDKIVGIDARGFLLAAPLAYQLKAGISIVRKKGKLPFKTINADYQLEYAENIIEMHQDTIHPGEQVVIVDDVLATGGTMQATINLVKKLKGKIMGISFLINLKYLGGEKKLKGYNIYSLINY